jgi:RND family efflux transporter MFP subunit
MLRRPLASYAICLLPFALSACGEHPASDARTKAPVVRVGTVQAASVASRAFTGVIAARVQSDLSFRVPGKVLERLVDAGQTVKRGQPLVRIDPIDLGLQARAQQQAVTAARARAKQTADDEARYRDLVAEGAVSASAYDQTKAAADAARAQLDAAEAQADVASNASSYAILVADADGVVIETLAEPGQVVSAGQTIVRLAREGHREALVHLPETLRPALGSLGQASLYGNPQDAVPATAKLRQLSGAADSLTRTFEARYVLEGPLARAPLGATVTVEIPDGTKSTPSLQVPIGAVFDPGKGTGVWVVEGKPAKVAWRSVQVLGLGDDVAQVTGNLKTGEQVVSLGVHLLREGDTVRPADRIEGPATGDRP